MLTSVGPVTSLRTGVGREEGRGALQYQQVFPLWFYVMLGFLRPLVLLTQSTDTRTSQPLPVEDHTAFHPNVNRLPPKSHTTEVPPDDKRWQRLGESRHAVAPRKT